MTSIRFYLIMSMQAHILGYFTRDDPNSALDAMLKQLQERRHERLALFAFRDENHILSELLTLPVIQFSFSFDGYVTLRIYVPCLLSSCAWLTAIG